MMENIFERPSARARHQKAPLLREREQYLAHLAQQGTSYQRIRTVAGVLLHVIRAMEMSDLRNVDGEEIRGAGERWAKDIAFHRAGNVGKDSTRMLTDVAKNWFRFLGRLIIPASPVGHFDELVVDFVYELQVRRGLAPVTVAGYGWRAGKFLNWLADRHDRVSSVSLNDVDDYLDMKRAAGWRTRSIVAESQALRAFFGHAEMRGWCVPNFARGIRSPRIPKYHTAPTGPQWQDVRKLIQSTSGSKAGDIRAHAIILLCSIYAFRSSEVVGLRLEDFDWPNETLTVKRAKRGRTQQYPIQYEVGEAILRYLQEVRPHCSCRTVFVTRYPPYRPIRTSALGRIVSRRMKSLKIETEHFGPHALRHSSATQLLKKGSSLQEIADFLGHRDTRSVSIYAKYDTRSLRKVAAFSLGWVR